MQFSPWMTRVNLVIEWLYRILYIDALCLFGLVRGGFILGVWPATLAAFAVARPWFGERRESPAWPAFWRAYRAEFWRANGLGWIAAGLGYTLYLDFRWIEPMPGGVPHLLLGLLTAATALYLALAVYLFPVLAHFRVGIFAILRATLSVSLARPLRTLAMMTVAAAGTTTALLVRGPLVVMSFGAWCVALAAIAYGNPLLHQRKEDKYANENGRQP